MSSTLHRNRLPQSSVETRICPQKTGNCYEASATTNKGSLIYLIITCFDNFLTFPLFQTNNTIDFVFNRKCKVPAQKDREFTKVNKITNLQAMKMRFEFSHHQLKFLYEKHRSYGRSEYRKTTDIMSKYTFSLVCHTNFDRKILSAAKYWKLKTKMCPTENERSTGITSLDNSKYIKFD